MLQSFSTVLGVVGKGIQTSPGKNHRIEMLLSQMDLTINSSKLAGRHSQYVKNWEQLTEGQDLASSVRLQIRACSNTLAGKKPEILCSTEE